MAEYPEDYTNDSSSTNHSVNFDNKRAVNYLVHRMLWGQEEKVHNMSFNDEGYLQIHEEEIK